MSQNLVKYFKTLNPALLAQRHQVFVTQKATKLIVHNTTRKGDDETEIDIRVTERIKKGFQIIKEGIPEYKDEVKEKLESDLYFFALHGDYEYVSKFNGVNSLEDWVVTADSDLGRGRSKASFGVTSNNKAVFHGYLDPWVPQDGQQKQSGFVNLRSPFKYKSFKRKICYDWTRYTHMYLRLRGDGRAYQLNVHPDMYFDHMWNDMYNVPIYTRGGPYWQICKVPFSKCFLTAASRIQDKQDALENNLDRVRNFSFTLADEVEGPFKLELDYIALVRDENHKEKYAYEMYQDHWSQIGQ